MKSIFTNFISICIIISFAAGTFFSEEYISPKDFQTIVKSNLFFSIFGDLGKDQNVMKTKKKGCLGFGSLEASLSAIFGPDKGNEVQTKFIFSLHQNRLDTIVYALKDLDMNVVDFDAKRKTVIIIHGFMSHGNATWIQEMKKAFLGWTNFNIIIVDWSHGGNSWRYWRAIENARQVSKDLRNFFEVFSFTLKMNDVHCIGHSLGAHICGMTSETPLNRFARITGLDPIQPCYQSAGVNDNLNSSCADYVDVIHTNGALLKELGLGYPKPIGTADFYPNGGDSLPGCDDDSIDHSETGSFVAWINKAVCSHGRAFEYFTESVHFADTQFCLFRARPWNPNERSRLSHIETVTKRCDNCPVMGIKAIGDLTRNRSEGTYWIDARDKKPYCNAEPPMVPGTTSYFETNRKLRNDSGFPSCALFCKISVFIVLIITWR